MRKKILIVDDEEDFCDSLEAILSEKGFNVSKAFSGGDALKKLPEFIPDLIVLDVVMPKMSGTDVCEKIRKDPSFHDTPVLMMTGYDNEDRKASSFVSGADDYLVKPFEAETLLSRIKELLNEELPK